MSAGLDQPIEGLVSVVVPAYNAEHLIGETVASILSQSYPAVELIVVDDGSTDATRSVLQTDFPAVRVVSQANSGGCSSPRNHGLRLARGEFVTFFDADDLMVRDKLQRQVDFLRRHPTCHAVLMDYKNFDEHGESSRTHFASCPKLQMHWQDTPELLLDAATAARLLITENYGIAGSPLIRRTVFEQVEAFDESLRASEDFDLIYRLARHSGLGLIAEVGFLRRMHESNMSRRTGHILKYKIASRCKLLAGESDQQNRALLTREIANYHLSMAEFSHRIEPRNSLGHVFSALRLGYPFGMRVAKGLVKCALGALRPA
ncbi:MAG: glycosyltransferase family A protein [Burkholderiaceae bacterium]